MNEQQKMIAESALEQLKQLKSQNQPWAFTIIAQLDGKQDMPVAIKFATDEQLEGFMEKIRVAIKRMNPDRLKILVQSQANGKDKVLNTYVIDLEPETRSTAKDHEQEVTNRLSELLQQNNQLSGLVNEKENTMSMAQMRYEHKSDMLIMQHNIEIGHLKAEIEKLQKELTELTQEHGEAITQLEGFEKIYQGEQKLQSGARMAASIAQGLVSVAPGLLGWVQKTAPALGSFATALTMPGEMPHELAENTEATDFSSPQFAAMQSVMQFCKELSQDELNTFASIVEKIRGQKDLLNVIASMV